MKKRLTALSLVSLIAMGTLVSCGDSIVNWEEGVIIKIGDKNYTIDDAYNEYVGYDKDGNLVVNGDGAKAYYNVVNNVLIQLAVPTTQDIKNVVKSKMESDFYDAAADSAKANGTTKKEEQEKILKSNSVETVKELENKFTLQEKTSRNEKAFYSDSNYKEMTQEFIDTKSPYHVKHILVKVGASSSDIYNAKITKENAEKLSNIVERLSGSTETFGRIAGNGGSDDTGSAANLGDVGIMTKSTEFVSEFKYSLYAYDSYFNENSNKTLAVNSLDIPESAREVVGEKAFGIPLSKAFDLKKYAEKTLDDDKVAVENSSESNFPRNILFTNYFNNHGMSFIYLDKTAEEYKSLYGVDINSSRFKTVTGVSNKLKEVVAKTEGEVTRNQYQDIDSKQILCDESGRPIIVTRAGSGTGDSGYQGVHFIVAQRSPFVDRTSTVDGKEVNNIADYYRIEIPSTTSAPTTPASSSYINFISTDDRTIYDARADVIRGEIKGFDSNMNFRIYKSNYDKALDSSVAINSKVETIISNYINNTRNTQKMNDQLAHEKSWISYLEQLQMQQDFVGRTLPEQCIDEFITGVINKKGVCYVTK